MNEQIQELLVKAREQTKEGKWNAPTGVWAEQFAKLIIRECCSIADEAERADVPVLASKFIKAHFGVEE